jgi:hypothetical protein
VKPSPRAVLDALPYAAAALKLAQEREKTTPISIPRFRGAANVAQAITDPEWLLSGPSETGKTFGGLWRLDALLRSTPHAKAAIVRKVRKDMALTVLETWDRLIRIRGGVVRHGGERVDFFSYPNGSRCWVAGLDDPGKVLSSELDWIYINQAEGVTKSDWEFCSTRTTGRGVVTDTPMLFGDCNPGAPTHWILKRDRIKKLHSVHRDNPTLYDELGILTKQGERTMTSLQALTGVRRERLYLGKWVQAEGTVYDFDRSVHLITRAEFEKVIVVRWVCGIDFGYTNPFVWQRWAMDSDGRLYLEREIYKTRRLVEDHAVDIKRLNGERLISATVADHDAEGRATLEKRGIGTIQAFKDVEPGIQNLQARLAVAGDGKPRLYVVEDACEVRDEALAAAHEPSCSLEEFEVYSWPLAPDGKPQKEVPIKRYDHGMDTARYVAAYVDDLHIEGTGDFRVILGEQSEYDIDEEGSGPGDEPSSDGRAYGPEP